MAWRACWLAHLHLLPDAGHFVHWEKAAEVNALVRDFVEGK